MQNHCTIKSSLLDRGYPEVFLDHTSYSAIKSIYEKPYLEFEGANIVLYNEETGAFTDYEIQANGIMPQGQIPTADLSLTWSVSKNSTGSEYFVMYSYEWLNLPFWRWQDPIGVSWDSTKFEMKDDTFYKVDMYDGFYSTDPEYEEFYGAIKSEEYGYAKGFNSGVTWYADLVGYLGITAIALYGHGEFTLTKLATTSGSTTLYGHYVSSESL
ncbi:MAG TPA: hypothetical protein VJ083_03075 [Sedimentibacter sp.]|nr:hypothetical protein [Sedimentibacter sp.]